MVFGVGLVRGLVVLGVVLVFGEGGLLFWVCFFLVFGFLFGIGYVVDFFVGLVIVDFYFEVVGGGFVLFGQVVVVEIGEVYQVDVLYVFVGL